MNEQILQIPGGAGDWLASMQIYPIHLVKDIVYNQLVLKGGMAYGSCSKCIKCNFVVQSFTPCEITIFTRALSAPAYVTIMI